ncbi:hypothetical protein G0Q06_08970 [Puniceicoccales bacterium CK1056]|uniref:Uncharacterized protein n=1 Tax=Oceanipulchritudo coccoides TaxID=2706888 RepID=A0A6B2M0T6_9BACT|nr:hypothetical protein [Oceanipulchritudo coccoides]NDV62581.1 hypothetical protein [Oceanipulchritudo coccoides]
MNKKHTIFVITCLMALSTGALGQVIIPVGERTELISGMQSVVGNMDKEAGDFTGLGSPFSKKAEADLAAEMSEGPVDIEEDVLPEVISDEIALDVISRSFKPDGSMIFGNRGILKLGNGETIEEGESFPAEIRGTTYTVEIVKVTARGYTLKVGDATVDKTFLKSVNQSGK